MDRQIRNAEIIRRRIDGFVPVKTRQGETIAAMNIGVHAARVPAIEMIHRFLPILQENARALGAYLG
jgi:DNA-binding IclR family transcriptional regulator